MERVSKDQPHSQENTPRLNGQAKDGAGPTCVAGTKKGRPPDLSPGNDNAKLVHEAHLVGATPMFRNLAIRKTEHAPVKVSLDRSIEEQYDLLDLEERLLQAGRGIVLKC